MSEFGLSENVFELQEEIFFLVLRIEDLEKQLKERPEVRDLEKLWQLHEPTQDGSLGPEQLGDKRHMALEAQLRDMQEMSAVLLCRLEELAAFLEQLLTYDGSGPLGSVTLSADVVAKMRQLIADSKDFSLSVSQSILGGWAHRSDTGSVLSEHHTRSSLQRGMHSVLPKGEKDGSSSSGSRKLDPKTIPPCPEDIAFMEDEVNMLREQVQLQQREISALTHRLEERAFDCSGRSKRPAPSARTESHKLEKLLRRVHHCNGKLEDSLVLHKELCHKMLAGPTGEKESPDQAQPSAELLDTHIQTMRKLQFKLEEMVINNELLLEILTEHLASGSMITTDSKMSAPSSGNTQASAAERLEQYKKELECKERRQEILKRAILREQNSKLQLEKELSECQKELQSLHEAHTSLKEDYKEVLRKTSDTGQREARQWNLRPQKDAKTSRAGKLEALGSSFEKSDNSEFVSGPRKPDGGRHSQGVARLSQEMASLREEVANLQEEKAVLTQKLETTQKEHEILLESSSNKISELVTKLGPLSTQNKIQQEEIRNARELNDNLAEENGKLQCDLDAAFSKLDALDRELESLQRENRDLRECVLASRSQENVLKERLEKIGEEFQSLKKTSEESARKGDVLQGEKDELATELSKLTAHLESYESEKQLLYEEKQRLILEVSAEKDQVERIANELQRCEEERDTLRTHGSELEAQLHASTEKLQEAEQMALQLKEELGATKGKLESMDVRCGQLEEELSSSKEAQRQLLWKSDELQRALDAVGREVQQNKSFARASLDRKHVMAFRELEDQNRSLQGAVMELKSKLDKAFHDNKCLRLELRVNEQFQPRSSPGTPSDHRFGPSRSAENHGQAGFGSSSCGASPPRLSPRQPSVDCGRQLQAGLNHARSHHTSPDLGIDSDPTPDHDVVANDSAGALAEHWQHRMGPSWTLSSVNSAPDAMGGSCQLCQQGKDSAASWKQKASATYAGEQLEQTSFGGNSPSKNVFPGPQSSRSSPSMPLCAIVQLVDHELLKKRVDESICLIRRVEVIIHQALDALADFASDCTEPPECKGLLQDADRGCHSIKVCLVDSFKLICSFTISHVPDCREDHCSHEASQLFGICVSRKQLKLELNKLQEKHSQQSIELQNALEQISSFKEKREGMERAISRQLSKTKMVLKQTKGNLNVLRTRDAKHEKK
ncbi:unnamed protein product [Ixodes pacificus]